MCQGQGSLSLKYIGAAYLILRVLTITYFQEFKKENKLRSGGIDDDKFLAIRRSWRTKSGVGGGGTTATRAAPCLRSSRSSDVAASSSAVSSAAGAAAAAAAEGEGEENPSASFRFLRRRKAKSSSWEAIQ